MSKNTLQIFRTGSFLPMGWDKPIEFSDDMLRDAAAVYDPVKHKAPIVIGHPTILDPAYGHIEALSFSGDALEALPIDVEPKFAELVNAKAFPHLSAGWYPPEHPRNPAPGHWYLREVSFLGAVPPAVRNLRTPSFSESVPEEEGIVRFSSEWDDVTNAGLWRRMREWFIGKFGMEEADKVIPTFDVQSLEQAAQDELREAQQEDDSTTMPGFAGANPEKPVSKDLAAIEAELEQTRKLLQEANARETASRDKQLRTEFAAFAETLCGPDEKGNARLKSKHKETVVDLLMLAAKPDANGGLIQFGEGEEKASAVDKLKGLLSDLPPVLNFAEQATVANASGNTQSLTDAEIANRAKLYKQRLEEAGGSISFAGAVDAVHANLDRS